MTQHNKEVEEIKDRCSHVKIWTENNYYYPEDVFIAEIKQAQAQGASKLAEELLGSDEMRLKNYPHQDATQDREIKSHNKSISAIIVLAEAIEIGRISGLVEEVSTILYGEHGDELLID